MTFLVLLIALVINYVWLLEFDRFNDGWFFRFRRRIETGIASLDLSGRIDWVLSLLLIYGVPILVLVGLMLLIDDRALGLPAMGLHVLVLLVALDRTQPDKLTKDFLRRWESDDLEASRRYLEEELRVPVEVEGEPHSLGRFFSKQLVYRCFENMFVMYFWYIFTGPVGVLVAYLSYQLRDSHHLEQSLQEVSAVAAIISLLEWIPLRLLALTFSLAGNFVHCFERLKESFWVFEVHFDAAEMIYGCANCALAGLVHRDQADLFEPRGANYQGGTACEIQAMRGLLERSQAIWLALLALITIFGLDLPG